MPHRAAASVPDCVTGYGDMRWRATPCSGRWPILRYAGVGSSIPRSLFPTRRLRSATVTGLSRAYWAFRRGIVERLDGLSMPAAPPDGPAQLTKGRQGGESSSPRMPFPQV